MSAPDQQRTRTRHPLYRRRVKLNAHGRESFPRRDPEQLGTILGETRRKTGWIVRWDGQSSKGGWHKDFLDVLPAGEAAA